MAESMICATSPQCVRNTGVNEEALPGSLTEAQFDLQTLNINQIFATYYSRNARSILI